MGHLAAKWSFSFGNRCTARPGRKASVCNPTTVQWCTKNVGWATWQRHLSLTLLLLMEIYENGIYHWHCLLMIIHKQHTFYGILRYVLLGRKTEWIGIILCEEMLLLDLTCTWFLDPEHALNLFVCLNKSIGWLPACLAQFFASKKTGQNSICRLVASRLNNVLAVDFCVFLISRWNLFE